jgi:hypothetical protein
LCAAHKDRTAPYFNRDKSEPPTEAHAFLVAALNECFGMPELVDHSLKMTNQMTANASLWIREEHDMNLGAALDDRAGISIERMNFPIGEVIAKLLPGDPVPPRVDALKHPAEQRFIRHCGTFSAPEIVHVTPLPSAQIIMPALSL